MTAILTDTELARLAERYPFSEDELQILLRCHEQQQQLQNNNDFLLALQLASPYQHYFLPGHEETTRVKWLEEHVLPPNFAIALQKSIYENSFVEYASQGHDKELERFLEGIAATGRRGTRDALRTLYVMNGSETKTAKDLVDMCLRLAVAADVLMEPNLDQDAVLHQIEGLDAVVQVMAKSLEDATQAMDHNFDLNTFVNWAQDQFPLLHTPLSTFVHELLFHEHKYPQGCIQYLAPKLKDSSDIFGNRKSPVLLAMSFLSPDFGGKWQRIYSMVEDGRSFNRFEWALLGYRGPTLVIIKTTEGACLGAYTATTWKESSGFYGDYNSCLFSLDPDFAIYRPTDQQNNYMYLHSRAGSTHGVGLGTCGTLHGLGLGGTTEQPRLFIPESFENCSARYLDKTFGSGNLLPQEALERFEIQDLEVWGVGGEERIAKALEARSEYRSQTGSLIERARTVNDKTQFAKDLSSGLIPNKVFAHQQEVRGRAAFEVDDVHGGYKLDSEKAEPETRVDAADMIPDFRE